MMPMTTLATRMAALADRLEADAPHSTSANGLFQAAEEIRAELAAEGPQTIWTVCHSDWGEDGLIAALTTRELADEFAKRQSGCVDVNEETIHDHIPKEVMLHCRSSQVLCDGTVYGIQGYSQSHWDCEQREPVTVTKLTDRDRIEVWHADRAEAERMLAENVGRLLTRMEENKGKPLADAIAAADALLKPKAAAAPPRLCYDASFGRVHVKSSCRCPR